MNENEYLNQLAEKSEYLSKALSTFADRDLLTLAYSELGNATIENLDSLSDDELQQIFLEAEQQLSTGSERSKDAIATGFLEAVVSSMDDLGIARDRVSGHFGPSSAAYVAAWDRFCEGE